LSPDEIVKVTLALQDLSERLLVMKKGTFHLFEELLPPNLKPTPKTDAI
jgi:hypothetical protein